QNSRIVWRPIERVVGGELLFGVLSSVDARLTLQSGKQIRYDESRLCFGRSVEYSYLIYTKIGGNFQYEKIQTSLSDHCSLAGENKKKRKEMKLVLLYSSLAPLSVPGFKLAF